MLNLKTYSVQEFSLFYILLPLIIESFLSEGPKIGAMSDCAALLNQQKLNQASYFCQAVQPVMPDDIGHELHWDF